MFEIEANGKKIASGTPLPSMSALKFRKDGPLTIFECHLAPKDNDISIIEIAMPSQLNEYRVVPASHLIGIYLVKPQQVS
jgi:hypothetical protein